MNRFVTMMVLLLPLTCAAEEFKFDLGEIDAPACATTSWSRNNPLRVPVPENVYAKRTTRLVATVIAMPRTQQEKQAIEDCGGNAKAELRDLRSAQNSRMFGVLFYEYMQNCVHQRERRARILESFVDYQEKCEIRK